MEGMGVFATKKEVETLNELVNMPVIMIGGYLPPDPLKRCHELALAHGLPEIEGYYGISADGEFLRE